MSCFLLAMAAALATMGCSRGAGGPLEESLAASRKEAGVFANAVPIPSSVVDSRSGRSSSKLDVSVAGAYANVWQEGSGVKIELVDGELSKVPANSEPLVALVYSIGVKPL